MRQKAREAAHEDPFQIFQRKHQRGLGHDHPAFDADKQELSLGLFAPLVREVMSAPRKGLYVSSTEERAAVRNRLL